MNAPERSTLVMFSDVPIYIIPWSLMAIPRALPISAGPNAEASLVVAAYFITLVLWELLIANSVA